MLNEMRESHANFWEGLQCPNCCRKMEVISPRIFCPACGMEASLDENMVQFPLKRKKDEREGGGLLEKGRRVLNYPLSYLATRRVAHYYERCLFDQTLAKEFQEHYLPSAFSSSKGTALDVGCGKGRFSAMLSLLGFQVTGLDLDSNPYWKRISQARFVVYGGEKFPFPDSAFDLITHFQVLMYIQDSKKHFQELRRVLKPGGYLTLQVANRFCLRKVAGGKIGDTKFYQAYSTDDLKALLAESGFCVERIFTEGFYSPAFPFLVDFLRTVIFSRKFNYFDRESLMVRITPPRYRGLLNVIAQKA